MKYGLVKQIGPYSGRSTQSYQADNTEIIRPRYPFNIDTAGTVHDQSEWAQRRVQDKDFINPRQKLQKEKKLKSLMELAKLFGNNFGGPQLSMEGPQGPPGPPGPPGAPGVSRPPEPPGPTNTNYNPIVRPPVGVSMGTNTESQGGVSMATNTEAPTEDAEMGTATEEMMTQTDPPALTFQPVSHVDLPPTRKPVTLTFQPVSQVEVLPEGAFVSIDIIRQQQDKLDALQMEFDRKQMELDIAQRREMELREKNQNLVSTGEQMAKDYLKTLDETEKEKLKIQSLENELEEFKEAGGIDLDKIERLENELYELQRTGGSRNETIQKLEGEKNLLLQHIVTLQNQMKDIQNPEPKNYLGKEHVTLQNQADAATITALDVNLRNGPVIKSELSPVIKQEGIPDINFTDGRGLQLPREKRDRDPLPPRVNYARDRDRDRLPPVKNDQGPSTKRVAEKDLYSKKQKQRPRANANLKINTDVPKVKGPKPTKVPQEWIPSRLPSRTRKK